MKNSKILYIIKFLLAFCSIVYELVLAQALSAFLENTVLRYSVTIGLYMFSMGVGSALAEKRFVKCPLLTLLRIEMLLTLGGGLCVVLLHVVDGFHFSRLYFSLFAHGLILTIGFLTGFELPLIMEFSNKGRAGWENTVLAVDYAGAVLGTVVFA